MVFRRSLIGPPNAHAPPPGHILTWAPPASPLTSAQPTASTLYSNTASIYIAAPRAQNYPIIMFECASCYDSYYRQDDCDEHMDDYNHWAKCETCPRKFRSHRACNQHMNTINHWAPKFDCETCNREFSSQNAANQHMNALGHWAPRVECETCNNTYRTQAAADKHMSDHGHYKHYCKPCDRRFDNESNLRAHLNSRTHRGTKSSCPFCKAGFVSASGVSHHLETSSCPNAPSLNRTSIARMVRRADPDGVITNKQIEYHDFGQNPGQYTVTRAAYNGKAWECYICHRQFVSAVALNQHANSPVHQQSIYHCPNRRRNCTKQFVSLAAFFNHLESESCGFIRFEKVQAAQRQLTDAMAGGRMIAGIF